MERFVIEGGHILKGEVSNSGAKNSALPLLFSTLLADGEHVFHNVPMLKDIESTGLLLQGLGCQVERKEHTLKVKVGRPQSLEAHYDIVRKMRASILCLGPLVARYGEAHVSLPGGCAIGTRPIDLHLESIKSLGAAIEVHQGYVVAKCKRLQGAPILFPKVTVGGTENALMAAVLAEGSTRIENAAKEPEIVDLAEYLNKMGAKIEGAGTSVIYVQGVDRLRPAEHSVIPDRIEAATLLIAGAITRGDVILRKANPNHFQAVLNAMKESGIPVSVGSDWVQVKAAKTWKGVDVTTAPHPGFPTDAQAQFMSLMIQAEGLSVITENIFENRFMHVQELARLNADIRTNGNVAIVHGTPGRLEGAPVMATDLRASASLVIAGLSAQGETTVNRIYHLDRGYEQLELKLQSLGGRVKRV